MTRLLTPLLLAAAVLSAACSDTSEPESGFEPAATVTDDAPEPARPDPTVGETANDTGGDPPTSVSVAPDTGPPGTPPVATPSQTSTDLDAVDVELVEIGTFELPVDLVDTDEALYVVQQSGQVVRFEPGSGDRSNVLDISDRVSRGNEQGLLGLAIDDQVAVINYTDTDDTTIVVAAPFDGSSIDLDAARTVLEIPQPFPNHNAGDLAFDADGNLLVPLGDGGSGGDPLGLANDPSTLLGSLIRIDITASGAPYRIPDDNPFAAGGEGRPEVWAWGLRNPWKIDIDPVTGDLWIADVGQNEVEEVNLVPAQSALELPARGAFFGWRAFEGNQVFDDELATDSSAEAALDPVHTYRHGEDGCSISGGVVARDSGIPGLDGAYVYGDHCSGRLWAFDPVTGANRLLRDDLGGLTAVRRGADGTLYTLRLGGQVSRIVDAS